MITAKKLLVRALRWSALGLLILIGGVVTYACIHAPYYSSKYSPGPQATVPGTNASALVPEVQSEGHTCGLHALSSVYRAYNLDPVEAQLRFRLGVDKRALPLAKGTEGTLHPDLFRVASQDGFRVERADLAAPEVENVLREHLTHNAAIALVSRGGGLHWIALDAGENGTVRVSDSLEPEVQIASARELLDRPLLSLILITPEATGDVASKAQAHATGLKEMGKVYGRMKDEQ